MKTTLHGNWDAPSPPPTPKTDPEPPTGLADILHDFAEGTTAHGVAMIARARHGPSRLAWLAVFLAMLAVFCSQGTQVVLEYLQFPSTTKVELVTNTNLTFPSVTVCNMNRFRRSRLVGTRFEDLINLDGGVKGESDEPDYSWWFDWDDEWYDEWYPDSMEGNSYTDPEDQPVTGYEGATDSQWVTQEADEESLYPDHDSQSPEYPEPARRRKRSAAEESAFDGDAGSYQHGESGGSVDEETRSSAYHEPPGFEEEDLGDFQFEEMHDWGNLTDEATLKQFYDRSTSPDYSDFLSIINPTREELKSLGHQANDFILQCTYNKRPCVYSDFHQFQNKEYGNCYTYNYNQGPMQLNHTKNSGAQYGLHLTLFLEMPEYVGILSPEAGVRVAIHSPSTPPFPEDDGITCAPGMATNIGLRQVYVQRLSKPYNVETCKDAISKETYSRKDCHKRCVQDRMLATCGCVSDILLENKTKCSYTNMTQETCRQKVEYLGEERSLKCNCPVACNETTYTKTVSSSYWPSERYEEHLQKRLKADKDHGFAAKIADNEESASKNLVRLRVYFEELNYQTITESPLYTFPNLLGNVGGLLGLYIGVSFLTLAEVINLLFDIFKFFARKVFGVNKVKPVLA